MKVRVARYTCAQSRFARAHAYVDGVFVAVRYRAVPSEWRIIGHPAAVSASTLKEAIVLWRLQQ
jgi:hypothetical protein